MEILQHIITDIVIVSVSLFLINDSSVKLVILPLSATSAILSSTIKLRSEVMGL